MVALPLPPYDESRTHPTPATVHKIQPTEEHYLLLASDGVHNPNPNPNPKRCLLLASDGVRTRVNVRVRIGIRVTTNSRSLHQPRCPAVLYLSLATAPPSAAASLADAQGFSGSLGASPEVGCTPQVLSASDIPKYPQPVTFPCASDAELLVACV